MKQHIATITDLLLGAAYADKRLEGHELAAITKLVCKMLGVDELPSARKEQIVGFNPAKFDAKQSAGALTGLASDDKLKVLELIVTINEADDVLDLDEDAYLRKVAAAMGLSEAEISELTLEILEEEEIGSILGDDA